MRTVNNLNNVTSLCYSDTNISGHSCTTVEDEPHEDEYDGKKEDKITGDGYNY